MPMLHLGALLLLSLQVPGQSVNDGAKSPAPHIASKPEDTPGWDTVISERRRTLVAQNGPGTDAALRDRLLKMIDVDQAARGLVSNQVHKGSSQGGVQHLTETDSELTSDLKQIVAERGWPTIEMVGIDASDAAMVILTHTPDHSWQATMLPKLESLADSGKIDPAPLALAIDKQLVATGLPQRYGSQFKNVNGRMAMYAVEDPGNLDRIRERAMLQPMAVYKRLLERMYGLRVTNDIVMPTPPQRRDPP